MKDIGDIIAIRRSDMNTIRKAQMRIAIIDATITSDPRYIEQLGDGSVAVDDFNSPLDIGEEHPTARFN